jgi:hypothetical protein
MKKIKASTLLIILTIIHVFVTCVLLPIDPVVSPPFINPKFFIDARIYYFPILVGALCAFKVFFDLIKIRKVNWLVIVLFCINIVMHFIAIYILDLIII